ncbi:MAG: serine esterase [Verrucomicrobia bacterium]|jgi:phospholipase/carboxylesterase|nr:serine esterase [Verrucomicrobiota bacterium]
MLETDLIPALEKDSRKLLVVLHGLGDSMEGYRWLPGALRLPWLNYLLVNAPDSYYGGYSWYDFTGEERVGVGHSYKLLAALLDTLRDAGYPSDQTGLFGFSQGCLMTIETGCRYPHKLGPLVGISGYVNDAELLAQEMSLVARDQNFLITHGTHDSLLPLARTRAHLDTLQRAGLKAQWAEFPKDHTILPEGELPLIREFLIKGFGK